MNKLNRLFSSGITAFSITIILLASGCATTPMASLDPSTITAPEPIQDNSGAFMSPYTSDGVVAEWVDRAVNVKMGASIGKTAMSFAGQKAMENVPFVGGMLGSAVGNAAGRTVAIEASGGMEFIKSTSDLSFNSVDDLAVYLFATHSQSADYQKVLEATWAIYPNLQTRYFPAIQAASRY